MLELDDVSAAYDTTPILRDVDLSVEEGEIVGVMGKNGVGKTTLLKTVMGLLESSEGTIRYDGVDVTHASADERARAGIGYIPQGRDVFPKLTVEQNIKMGETIRSDSDETLYDQIYDYFPVLEERASQEAGTLSGGQQQMLAIGRALVSNPDLLLLDEPSEGIQPSIVDQISQDMQTINADLGTTILFVEQNLGVIREMADRCYAMERGTVVDELGPSTIADEDAIAEYLAV
ncbi:ABC transporter ATP-binding protein [Haloarcula taiwanensis]|uniref:ABC transporter ATP-binding protein n=1 Tax=Haloarcula taiwanensis TaxID=1932004 RepID=A0A2H5A2S4_9EURY|nr:MULTISPECIES: ABC transporter ATP-binding protein [Haloarcula]AUG49005.1 ABC transporter ATP-binding protein [Haloarcula taiwanensis]RLM34798.1 ABC transporter ATP-binding protein [Haloarcula sp. Atlit-120R]RLM44212.1 ABC transporter ATP-binding protein [Haloarcula sp. Atlit-47R]RLM90490.1 ABC transporter ATP-binding protein [Haloarcula sp. Atlit-7R]